MNLKMVLLSQQITGYFSLYVPFPPVVWVATSGQTMQHQY